MPLKINPTSQIKTRLGIQKGGDVHRFLTATCAKHIDKYVPMDKGNLADYKLTTNLIIYNVPYAEYQYNGMRKNGTRPVINRTLDKHPLSTTYWDKRMVSAEMGNVEKEVKEYIKRRSKKWK
jgi:hypothetical protein